MLIAVFMVLVLGCSNHPPLEEMLPDDAYRHLEELYSKGKYHLAADGLNFFTLNYSGHSSVDSAQFIMGMSHYQLKEFLLAANAFDELVNRYPNSSLVPDAMFMTGLCYWRLSPRYSLDQYYTEQAIGALQLFIDYFPAYAEKVKEAQSCIEACREKLAHKLYATGVIYFKMKDYKAASIYFRTVTEEYYDTKWARKAMFQTGWSQYENKNYDESIRTLRSFITKYPDDPWHDRASALLAEAITHSSYDPNDD